MVTFTWELLCRETSYHGVFMYDMGSSAHVTMFVCSTRFVFLSSWKLVRVVV